MRSNALGAAIQRGPVDETDQRRIDVDVRRSLLAVSARSTYFWPGSLLRPSIPIRGGGVGEGAGGLEVAAGVNSARGSVIC